MKSEGLEGSRLRWSALAMLKRPKRPRDPNQRAKLILDIATGKKENIKPSAPKAGQRKGGLKGGKARAKKLSPIMRKRIDARAARALAEGLVRRPFRYGYSSLP